MWLTRVVIASLVAAASLLPAAARAQDAPAGGAAAPAGPGGAACASGRKVVEQPLPAEEIPGSWVDVDAGSIVVIEKAGGSSGTDFVLKARHEWSGSLAAGKLTFKRTPKPEEMSEAAPEWARKQVAGKLEWSLELEAKSRAQCGGSFELVIEGKWFPGELQFTEETDESGKIAKQDASVLGKGKPIDVKWRAPSVEIQLLAQTVVGPVHVSRFFYGVPTVIEAVFDQPLSDTAVPVTVTVDDSELKLTAKRDATDYRRFVTDILMPAAPAKPAGARPP
jgi:hypothetical protein